MTKDPEHTIEVEKLTKRYGDLLAVDDISFTVSKGEVFALLGPNGAGKTTTVEIIDTIRTPTSGKVSLLGMDVTKKKHDIVSRIGVLPQGFSSFDRITVRGPSSTTPGFSAAGTLTAEDNSVRYYKGGSLHGFGNYMVKMVSTPSDAGWGVCQPFGNDPGSEL